MHATITSKGQVTIPVAIREKFGLKAKDKIDFVIEGDEVRMRRVKTLRDFKGTVAARPGADEQAELEAAKKHVVGKYLEGMS